MQGWMGGGCIYLNEAEGVGYKLCSAGRGNVFVCMYVCRKASIDRQLLVLGISYTV